MPICYDIELEISRHDEEGEHPARPLPHQFESDRTLTREELENIAQDFFAAFMDLITGYDRAVPGQYSYGGGLRIISIFNC